MPEIKRMQWDAKYSVGVAIIDYQHQGMFEMINKLVDKSYFRC